MKTTKPSPSGRMSDLEVRQLMEHQFGQLAVPMDISRVFQQVAELDERRRYIRIARSVWQQLEVAGLSVAVYKDAEGRGMPKYPQIGEFFANQLRCVDEAARILSAVQLPKKPDPRCRPDAPQLSSTPITNPSIIPNMTTINNYGTIVQAGATLVESGATINQVAAGATQNIVQPGATQQIFQKDSVHIQEYHAGGLRAATDPLECNPSEPHVDSVPDRAEESPASPSAESAPSAVSSTGLCSYIIPNDIKPMEEVEKELRDSCATAKTLAAYVKKAVRLGYMDLGADNGRQVFEKLREHLGFTFKYSTWMHYY